MCMEQGLNWLTRPYFARGRGPSYNSLLSRWMTVVWILGRFFCRISVGFLWSSVLSWTLQLALCIQPTRRGARAKTYPHMCHMYWCTINIQRIIAPTIKERLYNLLNIIMFLYFSFQSYTCTSNGAAFIQCQQTGL